MRTRIIVAFAGMLAATPATAADLTGNNLQAACQESGAFCQGFAAGIVATTWTPVLTALLACLPKGATPQQLHDVLIKYLREHPEQRHHHYSDVIAFAIRDAWPCGE